MTLALYGKSNRRRTLLIVLALISVLGAVAGERRPSSMLWRHKARHVSQSASLPISFTDSSFLGGSNCDSGPFTSGKVWEFTTSNTFVSLSPTFNVGGAGTVHSDAKHAYVQAASSSSSLTAVTAVMSTGGSTFSL